MNELKIVQSLADIDTRMPEFDDLYVGEESNLGHKYLDQDAQVTALIKAKKSGWGSVAIGATIRVRTQTLVPWQSNT